MRLLRFLFLFVAFVFAVSVSAQSVPVVWIIGEITQAKADSVSSLISQFKKTGPRDIYVGIESEGGSIRAALDIAACLASLQTDITVHTRSIDKAAGAAAVILASGSKGYRTAGPRTRIMIHHPEQSDNASLTAEHLAAADAEMVSVLARATGRSEDDIRSNIDGCDSWFLPDAAAAFGLIDRVK